MIAAVTMENIADAIVEQGVTTVDEIASIVADLYALGRDGRSVMSLPRVVQAWAVRSPS